MVFRERAHIFGPRKRRPNNLNIEPCLISPKRSGRRSTRLVVVRARSGGGGAIWFGDSSSSGISISCGPFLTRNKVGGPWHFICPAPDPPASLENEAGGTFIAKREWGFLTRNWAGLLPSQNCRHERHVAFPFSLICTIYCAYAQKQSREREGERNYYRNPGLSLKELPPLRERMREREREKRGM